MKIRYIIIGLIFLACSCEEKNNVQGADVSDEPPVLIAKPPIYAIPIDSPVAEDAGSIPDKALSNDSTTPKLLIRPRIGIIKPAINEVNASKNETAAQPEQVPPMDPSSPKIIEKQPRILIAKPPVASETNETNLSSQPKAVPVATSIKITDDNKFDKCAHTMCPMIYCQNSLPPIPSQGICCQRCVTNPKCNTTACPKYKCVADLMPANLSAGECCDRCAPVTTTTATKETTSKQTEAPIEEESDDSSPCSSEKDSYTSSSSSSEQDNGRFHGCKIHHFNRKAKKHHSKFIGALTRDFSHPHGSHPHRCPYASNESEEK